MNQMPEDNEPEGTEPDIVIIGIDKKSYYLYKGDDHLNQILLVDGEYPTPILCVHFASVIDAKMMIGEGFNLSSYWGVHPDIIARLRDQKTLVETEV